MNDGANLFGKRSTYRDAQTKSRSKSSVFADVEKRHRRLHDEGLNRSFTDEKHRLPGSRGYRTLETRDCRVHVVPIEIEEIYGVAEQSSLVILALGAIAIARLSSSAIETGILDSRNPLFLSQRIPLLVLLEIRSKKI